MKRLFTIFSTIGAIYALISPCLILVGLVFAFTDNAEIAQVLVFVLYMGLNVAFSGVIGAFSGSSNARYYAPFIIPVALVPLSLFLLGRDPLFWIFICVTLGVGILSTVISSMICYTKKKKRLKQNI